MRALTNDDDEQQQLQWHGVQASPRAMPKRRKALDPHLGHDFPMTPKPNFNIEFPMLTIPKMETLTLT